MRPCLPPLMVLATLGLATAAYGQTCNDQIPVTAPDSRYTDHGDGTVTDTATGLMWRQCPEGLSGSYCGTGSVQLFTWRGGLQQAEAATSAGHGDWRLPNVKELSSLVDRHCFGPAINRTRFPNTPSAWFWSSSPYVNASSYAWVVNFYYGRVDVGYVDRDYGGYGSVRLVRGGE